MPPQYDNGVGAVRQAHDFAGLEISEDVLAELVQGLAAAQTASALSPRPSRTTARIDRRRHGPLYWIALQTGIAAIAIAAVWIAHRAHSRGSTPSIHAVAQVPSTQPNAPRNQTGAQTAVAFGTNDKQKPVVVAPPPPRPKPFGGRVTADGWELFVGEKAEALAFSGDGLRLAVASAQSIHLWNVETGLEASTPWRTSGTMALRFSPVSPEKQTLIAAATTGLVVHDGGVAWERRPFGENSLGPARALALSRDGRFLAAALGTDPKQQTIRVWTMANGRDAGGPESYAAGVTALSFSPDGKLFAAATNDGVSLWEVATWKLVSELLAPSPARAIAFSPDGRMLAAGGDAGTHLWDVHSWVDKFNVPGGHVTCVAFSPDGKVLVLGQSDGRLHCWDVAGRKDSFMLPAQTGSVTALAFLPKSRVIAVGGAAKTVRLFDLSKPAAPVDARPPG
jgi:hypothetical protein